VSASVHVPTLGNSAKERRQGSGLAHLIGPYA